MPDAKARILAAFEAAIADVMARHDVPPWTALSAVTHLLGVMIEEAPYSRAEKHELVSQLADRLHEAADA